MYKIAHGFMTYKQNSHSQFFLCLMLIDVNSMERNVTCLFIVELKNLSYLVAY